MVPSCFQLVTKIEYLDSSTLLTNINLNTLTFSHLRNKISRIELDGRNKKIFQFG